MTFTEEKLLAWTVDKMKIAIDGGQGQRNNC